MKILFLIVVSSILFAGVQSGREGVSGPYGPSRTLGEYTCPTNKVLVIYEQELPFAIHMFCEQPPVCQETLLCKTSPEKCLPEGLNFMGGVVEMSKYQKLEKTCCTYGPVPDKFESTECFDFEVTNKPRSQSRQQVKLPEGVEKYFGTRTRTKRGVRRPSNRVGTAEIYRSRLDGTEEQILIVSDISRIRDGYTVKACAIKCKTEKKKEQSKQGLH